MHTTPSGTRYTSGMSPLLAQIRALILPVVSCLLTLQVAGMHLHMCFDGQGPPLQVHIADAPRSHGPYEAGKPHVDREVPLGTSASVRAQSPQWDLPPLIPNFVGWSVARAPRFLVAVPTRTRAESLPLAPYDLLPPLRGPPLTAHA